MSQHDLEQVVRQEWGRLIGLLLSRYRRLDLVEDALADAVESAARTWPQDGVPDNPAAWLNTVASRRVLDRLRAEAMRQRREPLLVTETALRQGRAATIADPGGVVHDDLLRLVMMCSHPALSPEAASALALRLVLGVSTYDIARLFLVSETTMAARITRAKKKIVAAGIPFTVPDAAALPGRIDDIARTAYLAFTAGYAPGSGPDLHRAELAGEALRLVRVVLGQRPGEPALQALLALMLLQHSRRDARLNGAGELVLLPDQDRSRWHREDIAEAVALLGDLDAGRIASPTAASYLLQALIAAEHATAPTAADTRWDRIVRHYDQIARVAPSPAAMLARAVAVAEARGPEQGLVALGEVDLPGSHRPAAVRAELLLRCGRAAEAGAAFAQAIALCHNEAEARHLRRRYAALTQPGQAEPGRGRSGEQTPDEDHARRGDGAPG